MKKINLKLVKINNQFYYKSIVMRFKSCSPFIENKKARLIHRPVSMTLFKCTKQYHISLRYACGLIACGTDKFTFLDDLSDDQVVCQRCEQNAIKLGYMSSESICDRHVHIGSTKVVKACCVD